MIYRGKPMDLFTDFAWSSQTGLLTVCSTTEILWFDTRYNKRPLFSVNHGRKHDRHLRISNFTFDEGESPKKVSYQILLTITW